MTCQTIEHRKYSFKKQSSLHAMRCLLNLNNPFLGEHAELQRQESADGHSFQQGDKVKCLLDVDILRQMQEGHGGWNPKMAEVFESSPLASTNEQWPALHKALPTFSNSIDVQNKLHKSLCSCTRLLGSKQGHKCYLYKFIIFTQVTQMNVRVQQSERKQSVQLIKHSC